MFIFLFHTNQLITRTMGIRVGDIPTPHASLKYPPASETCNRLVNCNDGKGEAEHRIEGQDRERLYVNRPATATAPRVRRETATCEITGLCNKILSEKKLHRGGGGCALGSLHVLLLRYSRHRLSLSLSLRSLCRCRGHFVCEPARQRPQGTQPAL
jgi:hypothetical protein